MKPKNNQPTELEKRIAIGLKQLKENKGIPIEKAMKNLLKNIICPNQKAFQKLNKF